MSLDRFIKSVRMEVAKKHHFDTDYEIDAFFLGLEEAAKDNQEALERRDKMLRDTVAELCEAKRLLKAADVQPAPQWISVDERVPDNDAPVLVWYEYWRYGDYNCMWQAYGIAQYIYDRWTGEDLNGSRVKVLAWQPLPEPPKE